MRLPDAGGPLDAVNGSGDRPRRIDVIPSLDGSLWKLVTPDESRPVLFNTRLRAIAHALHTAAEADTPVRVHDPVQPVSITSRDRLGASRFLRDEDADRWFIRLGPEGSPCLGSFSSEQGARRAVERIRAIIRHGADSPAPAVPRVQGPSSDDHS